MQTNKQEQHQEPQPVLSPPATSNLALILPANAFCADALPEQVTDRIEDYLDHVCAPLVREIPYSVRREWRTEMRIHLESLTGAHIELNAEPEAAVESALAQFGSAQAVSREWQQEWEHAGKSNSACASARTALQWYGGGSGLTLILLLITGDLVNQGLKGLPVAAVTCLLTPLLAGAGVGSQARHPIKATLLAVTRLAIPLLLSYILVFTYAHGFHYIHFNEDRIMASEMNYNLQHGWKYALHAAPVFALCQVLCWTIIGLPTAALTRLVQKRTHRRLARIL